MKYISTYENEDCVETLERIQIFPASLFLFFHHISIFSYDFCSKEITVSEKIIFFYCKILEAVTINVLHCLQNCPGLLKLPNWRPF